MEVFNPLCGQAFKSALIIFDRKDMVPAPGRSIANHKFSSLHRLKNSHSRVDLPDPGGPQTQQQVYGGSIDSFVNTAASLTIIISDD
jgi:hypothetical protein